MVKGLIVGALAFVGAFAAERFLESVAGDIARYDRMRKMSGQESLGRELAGTFGSFLGTSAKNNAAGGLVSSLSHDLVRYAKLRAM